MIIKLTRIVQDELGNYESEFLLFQNTDGIFSFYEDQVFDKDENEVKCSRITLFDTHKSSCLVRELPEEIFKYININGLTLNGRT